MIVLCGMGIQINLTSYIIEIDEVWNLGLAGSLRDGPAIGTLLQIKTVGDSKQNPLHLDEGDSKLITSPIPIHDHTLRDHLAKEWDLVDMEGYGIAKSAHHLGKKCRMWKIISDFASPGGRELIRRNMARSSELLAEKIHEAIHESCPHS